MWARRQKPAHRRASSLQGALDRDDGHLQHLRGLLRGQAERVTQDQDRPLAGRQVLDGRQVGQLDRLPRQDDSVGLGVRRRHRIEQVIGVRLEPGNFRRRGWLRPRVAIGCGEVGRREPSRLTQQRVETDVRCDAVQPGAKQRRPSEAGTSSPGAQHGLLDRVFGVVDRPEHAITMQMQLPAVALGQRDEDRFIAGLDVGRDRRILGLCRPPLNDYDQILPGARRSRGLA